MTRIDPAKKTAATENMEESFRALCVSRPALPVIDIQGCYSTDPGERRRVAAQIRAACLDKGFLYVTGHRVAPALIEGIFEQARRFFGQPDAVKRMSDKVQSPANRGYERLGGQMLEKGARPDCKEGFYIGRDLGPTDPRVIAGRFNHGANVWPDQMPEFRSAAEGYFEAMGLLADVLIRALALALDLDEGFFDEFCHEASTNLRLLHYPPQAADADAATRGAGAHTDFGCITVLLQDDNGGLQVFDKTNGRWIHASPIPGAFVVNLGDLIERWTNGRFASTTHRVINASGRERYSVAFFYSGNPDHEVRCLPGCLGPGERPKYPPTTVEAHLRECYAATYGGL